MADVRDTYDGLDPQAAQRLAGLQEELAANVKAPTAAPQTPAPSDNGRGSRARA